MIFRIIFCLTLLVAFSCSGGKSDADFRDRYGEQVAKMREQKTSRASTIISKTSKPPTESEILKKSSYHPYISVTKFGERPKQHYLPSNEAYDFSRQAASRAGLAPDVFELNYSLSTHSPFRAIGIEFDNILIPRTDAYGVRTALSEKHYLSPGGGILQKTIDQIIQNQSDEDVEMSFILINEKKEIGRKEKMNKIFGAYKEMRE